jgi:hypothetical protein
MVTKIIKVQQDSSIFIFGHYKCPIFNFGEWSWEKISKVLYILSIFLLKDHFTTFEKSWAKSFAEESLATD